MKDCREADSGCECAVVVNLIECEGFAHESYPPVKGADFRSVTIQRRVFQRLQLSLWNTLLWPWSAGNQTVAI
jgi:hypothetical protein